jgi:hypothetical protein
MPPRPVLSPDERDAGRKAAIDRIPEDRMSEEPFDRGVGLPRSSGRSAIHQRLYSGPLDHAVPSTTSRCSVRHRSTLATRIRKTRIENAPKRWKMVCVHLGA